MLINQAIEVAREWVNEVGAKKPDFMGAFIAGSATMMQADDVLSRSSDVDLFLVADDVSEMKVSKFIYKDVLFEVVPHASGVYDRSAEDILGEEMAGSFKAAIILADTSGKLAELQRLVAKDYHKRKWVRARCDYTITRTLAALDGVDESVPLHDQISLWLNGASLPTYTALMAGLKIPTVRKRYLAARELLTEYDQLDFYEDLLEVAGFGWMSREDIERHLDAVTEVFDVVAPLKKTPYRFASDVSEIGRPIAIGGSRALIERGYHREAMFYLVRTYCRCQHVLLHDAPEEVRDQYDAIFRRLLGEFDIASFEDLQRRCDQVRDFLPRVLEVAEEIMCANSEIED